MRYVGGLLLALVWLPVWFGVYVAFVRLLFRVASAWARRSSWRLGRRVCRAAGSAGLTMAFLAAAAVPIGAVVAVIRLFGDGGAFWAGVLTGAAIGVVALPWYVMLLAFANDQDPVDVAQRERDARTPDRSPRIEPGSAPSAPPVVEPPNEVWSGPRTRVAYARTGPEREWFCALILEPADVAELAEVTGRLLAEEHPRDDMGRAWARLNAMTRTECSALFVTLHRSSRGRVSTEARLRVYRALVDGLAAEGVGRLVFNGADVIGSRDAAVHDLVVDGGLTLEPGGDHPEQDLIADLLDAVRWALGADSAAPSGPPPLPESITRRLRRIDVAEP